MMNPQYNFNKIIYAVENLCCGCIGNIRTSAAGLLLFVLYVWLGQLLRIIRAPMLYVVVEKSARI